MCETLGGTLRDRPEKEEVVGSSGCNGRSRLLSAHSPLSVLTPSPVPTIVWRRADGKPIARKARRHQSDGILEIPNFQQEDAGLYECVAENSRGKNVARGQLTFYGESLGMRSVDPAPEIGSGACVGLWGRAVRSRAVQDLGCC